MYSVFILRRDPLVARRTQQQLETTRDLRVHGLATSLYRARAALAHQLPDLLLTDLQLEDGAAVSLITELRRRPGPHPKVLALSRGEDDALAMPTLVAGADNLLADPLGEVSPVATIERVLRGEAALSAALARRVLGCMHALDALDAPAGDDRRLDWQTDAHNPMKLSAGERRLLALLARGEPASTIAVRTGLSLEHVGRHVATVYRKLQWDVRTGQLSLRAA